MFSPCLREFCLGPADSNDHLCFLLHAPCEKGQLSDLILPTIWGWCAQTASKHLKKLHLFFISVHSSSALPPLTNTCNFNKWSLLYVGTVEILLPVIKGLNLLGWQADNSLAVSGACWPQESEIVPKFARMSVRQAECLLSVTLSCVLHSCDAGFTVKINYPVWRHCGNWSANIQ